MKIALIGYGNMGQEIAGLVAENKTDSIVSISYGKGEKTLDLVGIKKADVVIDFTSADIFIDTLKRIAALKKPIIVGTTGWHDQIDLVEKIVDQEKIGLIYGQNFSIGANIFFKTIAYASSLINKFDTYDVYGIEVHHAGKKDSPSGTAKKLAEIILENLPAKKTLQVNALQRQIKKEELHFTAIRAGKNPGKHEIIFDSPADEITLKHQAHNRRGFAEGALLAARFIKNKKGLYRFDDVFEEVIK